MPPKAPRPFTQADLTPREIEEIRVQRQRADREKEYELEMKRSSAAEPEDGVPASEEEWETEPPPGTASESLLVPKPRILQIPRRVGVNVRQPTGRTEVVWQQGYWSTRMDAEKHASLVRTIKVRLQEDGMQCIGRSGMPDLVERLAELGVSPVAKSRKGGALLEHKPRTAPLYRIARAADAWLSESTGETPLRQDSAPSAQRLRGQIAQQAFVLLQPQIDALLDRAMAVRAQPFHAQTSMLQR